MALVIFRNSATEKKSLPVLVNLEAYVPNVASTISAALDFARTAQSFREMTTRKPPPFNSATRGTVINERKPRYFHRASRVVFHGACLNNQKEW